MTYFSLPKTLIVCAGFLCVTGFMSVSMAAQPRSRMGDPKPLSNGTPQKQAPYKPGRSPYITGLRRRNRYFVPPTIPRTPTWKMYGTPPGVEPGDWPSYAPFGFGGYRFPAVGAQAYR